MPNALSAAGNTPAHGAAGHNIYRPSFLSFIQYTTLHMMATTARAIRTKNTNSTSTVHLFLPERIHPFHRAVKRIQGFFIPLRSADRIFGKDFLMSLPSARGAVSSEGI